MAKQKRKTILVDSLRTEVNRLLALPDLTNEARLALASLLETFLMQTNNYKGFTFVHWMKQGLIDWQTDGRPADVQPYLGNETQRYYF